MGTAAYLLPHLSVRDGHVHSQGWHLHTPILTIFFPSSLLALAKQKTPIYSSERVGKLKMRSQAPQNWLEIQTTLENPSHWVLPPLGAALPQHGLRMLTGL